MTRQLTVDSQWNLHIIQIKCSSTTEVTEPSDDTHNLPWSPAQPLPGKFLLDLILSIIINCMQMFYNCSHSSFKTCSTTIRNATKTQYDPKTRRASFLVWQCWGHIYPHNITTMPTTPSSNSITDLDSETIAEYSKEATTQRDLKQLEEHFKWF